MTRDAIEKRLKWISLILVGIIMVGTIGYKLIGGAKTTFLDALFMTAITITTVGYGDVVGAANTAAGKVFTVIYVFLSVGTIFYLLTALASYMVEGEMRKAFRRRSMEKRIERMRNHYIVCGMGLVGLYIVRELYETRRPQIAVDFDASRFEFLTMRNMDVPVLLGDATENELLEKAMVREAKGLFATTNSDNDNVVIALTAKQLNPDLRVVCRCTDTKNIDKMKRAGADNVVALSYIGGLRMAAEMIRPHATDFMESMLRDKEQMLRVEEVTIPSRSEYVGKKIEDLQLTNMGNLLLLAIRKGEGDWVYNPPPALLIERDMRLIVLATPDERQLLQSAVSLETAST
jgi:voltage-gated potassium channel